MTNQNHFNLTLPVNLEDDVFEPIKLLVLENICTATKARDQLEQDDEAIQMSDDMSFLDFLKNVRWLEWKHAVLLDIEKAKRKWMILTMFLNTHGDGPSMFEFPAKGRSSGSYCYANSH